MYIHICIYIHIHIYIYIYFYTCKINSMYEPEILFVDEKEIFIVAYLRSVTS